MYFSKTNRLVYFLKAIQSFGVSRKMHNPACVYFFRSSCHIMVNSFHLLTYNKLKAGALSHCLFLCVCVMYVRPSPPSPPLGSWLLGPPWLHWLLARKSPSPSPQRRAFSVFSTTPRPSNK